MTWKNNWILDDDISATLLNDLATLVNTHDATSKSTPVDADEVQLLDSTATFAPKKLTWANLKATLASAGFYKSGGTDVPIADGGTGASTLPSGLLKGAGTGAITAAVSGTDYVVPSGAATAAAAAVHATTTKTTPAVGDEIFFLDSAASFAAVRVNVLDFLGGVATYIASTAMTLTNKAITPRVGAAASTGTISFDATLTDEVDITALAVPITSIAYTGTPVNGHEVTLRYKDNGTARAIAHGAQFISGPAVMLTTTVISKTHYEKFRFDSTAVKYVCILAHAAGY